ncbi:MAG: DUF6530 family protein [Eubacteriales bacterium]
MKIPTNLQHKPIFGVESYNKIDGTYVSRSDAPCLSLGVAQWNQNGSQDISVKVWRNDGDVNIDYQDGNWSRMSEELPIHRNLDLTILICKVMYMMQNNLHNDTVLLQGEDVEIKKIYGDNTTLFNDLIENDIINERLIAISDILKKLGY